jgi:hypothetical protein
MIDKIRIQNFLFFSALFLLVLGLLGFIIGFYSSMNTEGPPKTAQKLPLGDLAQI